MHIENCTINDIDTIFELYDIAAAYQKAKQTVVVWPLFERQLVVTEITEKRQWKLLIDGVIACVWATTDTDEEIWEDRNVDAAIYIHRIATNPAYRGNNFVGIIVAWAKTYAQKNNKDFVRLDTLGYNEKLIQHYTSAGFSFLGMVHLTNTTNLPAHYQNNIPAALFEIKL